MGIPASRTARLKAHYLSNIKDILSTAKHFHHSHAHILAQYVELFDQKEYKLLPMHAAEYLRGYRDALHDATYRYDLTWRMYVPMVAKEPFCFIDSIQRRVENRNGGKQTHIIANLIKNVGTEEKPIIAGALLTKEMIDILQTNDPRYKDIWSMIDSDLSRHCWNGRPDKPF